MRDPHVVALHYRLEAMEGISYHNASYKVCTPEFEGVLEAGKLVATMLAHYPTENEARIPVDAFLRAWEISGGITVGRAEMTFVLERSEVIDRAPPEPGLLRISGAAHVTVTGFAAHLQLTRNVPPPPVRFAVTPLVESLWQRYDRYTQGYEPLLTMAYFCVTRLEREAGGTKAAAARFYISRGVLEEIKRLSSTRGDESQARKAIGHSLTPITDVENEWLRAAIPAVIKQIATVSGGATPNVLTMADLPRL